MLLHFTFVGMISTTRHSLRLGGIIWEWGGKQYSLFARVRWVPAPYLCANGMRELETPRMLILQVVFS